MKVTRVEVRDFKGIKVVEIIPKQTTTVVGGKNLAGKSSFIDATGALLGGKKLCPAHPIRRGQERARIAMQVDGDAARLIPPCTITRDFWRKKDGTIESKLEIVTAEGYRAPAPMAMLEQIVGNVGFDPESFLRMSAKEQAETLRTLVGLDTSALDAEYAAVYAKRKTVNAAGVKLRVDFERMPYHPDAPGGEISPAALVAELRARQNHNQENAKARKALSIQLTSVDMLQREVAAQQKFVEDLEERLENARAKLAALVTNAQGAAVEVSAAEQAVALLSDQNTAEIEQQIADSEAINRKVRANVKRAEAEKELDLERAKSAEYTEHLRKIELEKAALQAKAKWPVPGLGFDAEGGVTFNDLPFEQCSASEQRRVAVGIRCAENPTLGFFYIKDGSLLDDDAKAEVALLAAQHGCQCFMEVVGTEGTSIVIADGEIAWAEEGMLPLEKAEPLPEEP